MNKSTVAKLTALPKVFEYFNQVTEHCQIYFADFGSECILCRLLELRDVCKFISGLRVRRASK
jgi:hypothetical protein